MFTIGAHLSINKGFSVFHAFAVPKTIYSPLPMYELNATKLYSELTNKDFYNLEFKIPIKKENEKWLTKLKQKLVKY